MGPTPSVRRVCGCRGYAQQGMSLAQPFRMALFFEHHGLSTTSAKDQEKATTLHRRFEWNTGIVSSITAGGGGGSTQADGSWQS